MAKKTMIDNHILNLTFFGEIKNKEKKFNEIKNNIKDDIKQEINNDYIYFNKCFKLHYFIIILFKFLSLSIFSMSSFLIFYYVYLYQYLLLSSDDSIRLVDAIFLFTVMRFCCYSILDSAKESIEENKKLKKLLEDENKINYFMPLSSQEIAIICHNNNILKEHLINNNYDYVSMQLIDYISGKDIDLKYVCGESNNYGIDIINNFYSEIEKDYIFNVIKEEQNKFKDINNIDIFDFEVTYTIKNGPTKNITFKHSHEDHNAFKNYIENVVENNYGRGFDIIKINKV